MAKKKSAKAAKLRNNIIVHTVLAILAAIWVFPVLWVVMTSFRAKRLLCFHLLPPVLYL